MSTISLKVNGRLHTLDVDPETPLLFVLSDELGLRGPKFGCGMAQCGACTVILRGRTVRSCVKPVSAVLQDEVTTLEGLDDVLKLTISAPVPCRKRRRETFMLSSSRHIFELPAACEGG